MEKEESIKNRAVIYIENPCVIFFFFLARLPLMMNRLS